MLKRNLLDGIHYEALAEEFDCSRDKVARLIPLFAVRFMPRQQMSKNAEFILTCSKNEQKIKQGFTTPQGVVFLLQKSCKIFKKSIDK